MNLLIIRSGTLGDTLVALPALWALRGAFPQAQIKYVLEIVAGQDYVPASEVLTGSGLVDSYDEFCTGLRSFAAARSRLTLWRRLRRTRWDIGISLAEPFWSPQKKRFIRYCGAKVVLGPEGLGERHPRSKDGRLLRVPHIADTLVQVLAPLNLPLPATQQGRFDLGLNSEDETRAQVWLEKVGIANDGRPWIALGLGSKMPIKRWPLDRYAAVVKTLISEFNVVPFVFGGMTERSAGETFITQMDCGQVICGDLPIRPSASLMRRCAFYLGNDTGAMHLAAAAGIPCVAIFSSRDSPGRWEPYGAGHVVFRQASPTEGSMQLESSDPDGCGLLLIQPDEVLAACRNLLKMRLSSRQGR